MTSNTRFAVAVHVLTYLQEHGSERPVGSEELAGSAAVNAVYVRRVLGPLRRAGLVRSLPGSRGGWELARRPGDIGLDQVWTLLQGDEPVLGLHGPNQRCAVGASVTDLLADLDRDVTAAVREELAGRTVLDLRPHPPE